MRRGRRRHEVLIALPHVLVLSQARPNQLEINTESAADENRTAAAVTVQLQLAKAGPGGLASPVSDCRLRTVPLAGRSVLVNSPPPRSSADPPQVN